MTDSRSRSDALNELERGARLRVRILGLAAGLLAALALLGPQELVRQPLIDLFHHEPTYSDEDISRMWDETVRYEELVREGRPPLEVICAYDGLEVTV